MPLLVFFGCLFIAFGPSLSIFWFTISKYPLRIILIVVGAFFWLLSLLLSALLWLAVVPLRDVLALSLVFSVLFQELARFALFALMSKAKDGLAEALTDEEKQSIVGHKLSYVLGFGFGLMSGLFSIVNVLANSIGPGNVGISGSSSDFFMISSFLASAFILLHTFWNVILFSAYEKKQYYVILLTVASHMLVSCMTLLNVNSSISYISVIIAYVVLIAVSFWAFVTAGGSVYNIKVSFSCSS